MTERIENPYQVLGIPRNADERAIKKAYFALIRKHPPDSQPEEFKRIRQAYELLSDPVARRRYDAMDRDYVEYGDDTGAALREAEEAAKSGDEAGAQQKLRHLLEQQPDLKVARENLVGLLLKSDSHKDALALLDELCEAAPDEARYWAQRAFVLHRLEKPENARESLRKAHDLAPDNIGIHLELVDMLLGYRKYDDAIGEIDGLLKKKKDDEKAGDLPLLLRLRKLDALYGSGNAKAEKQLERIVREANAAGDPEVPKFVASQLATVAAKLFARKEYDKANALLEHASKLYPESSVLCPYPPEARLDVSALPEEGQRWLSELAPGPHSPTLARTIWPAPILLFMGGVASAVATFFSTFNEPDPLSGGFLLGSAVGIGVSAFMLSVSIRRILDILKSPVRAFLTIHPLYVVRATANQLHLYPLFNLDDVQAVHQHTNGMYSGTTMTLDFHGARVSLTLSGREFAEGWLQFLLESRRRALELMLGGYLEAEHGVDLIPPKLLSQPQKVGDRRATVRFYAGAAAAALLVWGVLLPIRAWAAGEEAWRKTARVDTMAAYQEYLDRMPDGRHAGEARKRIGTSHERARAALRVVAGPGAEPSKALLDALDRLEAARGSTVPVVVDLSDSSAGQLRNELVQRLNRVLLTAGLSDVMRLELVSAPDQNAPVLLSIRARAKQDGDTYEAKDVSGVPANRIDWVVDWVVPAENKTLQSWTTSVDPPDTLRIPQKEGESQSSASERVRAHLSRRALEAFFVRFVEQLALKSAAMPSQRDLPVQFEDAKEASPYAR